MMQTFLTIVGGIAVVALVVTPCYLVMATALDRFVEKWRTRVAQQEYDRITSRYRSDAYWFSEDEPTMSLLLDMAEGRDVAHARDQWRKKRALKEPLK